MSLSSMTSEASQSSSESAEGVALHTALAVLAERDAVLAERDAVLAERDAVLAVLQAEKTEQQAQYTRLWNAYERLKEELALIKRRLFVATAERVDTTQLQLEFEALVTKLDALSGSLPGETDKAPSGDAEGPPDSTPAPKKTKPKGRRDLKTSGLPEVRVEIADVLFEKLVDEGKAERIGFEESSKLGYERGGHRHIVTARVKYRAMGAKGPEIETAAVPKEVIPRCLATASTLAHIATNKFCDGLPLYRQQDILGRTGASIDRGTMARWMEQIGATFGATLVEAMRKDALSNAFCIMTDATGFAVQPGRFDDKDAKKRRPCRKGHYFVQIADRDHVFFEFKARHTSQNVRAMFKGFEGYVQADASSVYDALFRPAEPGDPDDDGCARTEVGCWSHARRKYWEAALAKSVVAREALVRIGKIFETDRRIQTPDLPKTKKRNPPATIRRLRQKHLRPLVDEFFEFAETEYQKVKGIRGSLRSALGYSVRQKEALRTFLDDGSLRTDNNLSENALRKIVRIRDASLFAGSDEHAESAGHILSLIASARMHNLDPERYLRDILRVLPSWPRARFLELAPKYWTATRATLNQVQLNAEVGDIDVPPALPAAPPR
jgi:transposase